MSRSSSVPKLPLATWAKIIGIHPLHFEGVQLDVTRTVSCAQTWPQYSWQASDMISREELAEAICQSEAILERYIGYRLLPAWDVDEWQNSTRPMQPDLYSLSSRDVRWKQQAVTTQWAKVLSGGIRSSELIESGVTIAWSDADGDGYEETGTVSINTGTLVHADEFHLYYPGYSGSPEWEIRPLMSASISSGVGTFTFRRELAVLDTIMEAVDWEPVDGLVDANFLTTVDVYRVYNDPQIQANFLWEPVGDCGCGTSTCAVCGYTAQDGCLLMRNATDGIVAYHPADWDADNLQFVTAQWAIGRQPDIVRLYYYSGHQDKGLQYPTIQMDPTWARTVAYLAASMLDRPVCSCAQVNVDRWREDLSFRQGAEQFNSYFFSPDDLTNPFGPTRGGSYAWRRVHDPNVAISRNVVVF